jgi:ribonuclease HI
MGPFEGATNNIGEFLAIVHGLAWLKKQNLAMPIYSDSMTAQAWIRQKKCKSKLEPTAKNAAVFELVTRLSLFSQRGDDGYNLAARRTVPWRGGGADKDEAAKRRQYRHSHRLAVKSLFFDGHPRVYPRAQKMQKVR